MREFVRPIVVVSKCLGFAHCRYNGQVIADDFVAQLEEFVTYVTTCPEVEIGLGVPRDPIRLVVDDDDHRLVQPATGQDVTQAMKQFAHEFLSSLELVDGFILKGRSPSCGFHDVKVYPHTGKASAVGRDAGAFGGAVLKRFPWRAIESEGRLKNYRLREHFLTKLFTLASFRDTRSNASMGDLVDFQADNKLLLMAYDQVTMRKMGRAVANPEHRPVAEVFAAYEEGLAQALADPPRPSSSINVLMHALGYFSDQLSSPEKAYFLDSLDRYRDGQAPLSVPIGIMGAWITRFDEPYLARQTFFSPYPKALVAISDSGKGRDL
jgi:uncharacterized protein YbgA (DUF1722 family)/uncharacterized protein YbbK (DUF523 family)